MNVEFVVENAGCASCAALVRDALGEIGLVESITVDEPNDSADVRLSGDVPISVAAVNAALADASSGSGHVYRVSPGTWITS